LASTWINLHQTCELRYVPSPYRFRSEAISVNGANKKSDMQGSEPNGRSCEGSSE